MITDDLKEYVQAIAFIANLYKDGIGADRNYEEGMYTAYLTVLNDVQDIINRHS